MFRHALRSIGFLGLLVVLSVGCSTSEANETPTEQSVDELSLAHRTFRVGPSGDGCSLPHATLYVKRGGKVTFDNGTWLAPDEELTGDDNLSFLIEWPNALGEDGAAQFDVTTGEKHTVAVPYLEDELFGAGRFLEFDLYCTSLASGEEVGTGQPQARVRIYR